MPATRTNAKSRNARKEIEAVAKRPSLLQSAAQSGGHPNASSEVAIASKLEDNHILVAASKAGRIYKHEYGADIRVSILVS